MASFSTGQQQGGTRALRSIAISKVLLILDLLPLASLKLAFVVATATT